MLTDTEPRDLMCRAQAGDVDAFGELYARYRPQVFSFLTNRGCDSQVAADLTQDTFARAFGSISRWQWQGVDPRAWLFTIARNLCASYYRAQEQSRRQDMTDLDGYLEARPDESSGADPEAAAIQALGHEAILRALRVLTEEQREAVVQHYVHGRLLKDIAKDTGRTKNAVAGLLHRARQNLAPRLAVMADV